MCIAGCLKNKQNYKHDNRYMKTAVYIESSVISYLTARPSRDVVKSARQAITEEWWTQHRQRFEVFISALVEEEISAGDENVAKNRLNAIVGIPSADITLEAENIAQVLVKSGAVPENSVEDALHIGIAVANGIEFLLTWNFKHINNAEKKNKIIEVIESQGYRCPVLCSPEELGGIL